MAIKKEIEIIIRADGSVDLETHGFIGTECETETKDIEKALGQVKKRERKKEYFSSGQTAKTKQKQTTSTK